MQGHGCGGGAHLNAACQSLLWQWTRIEVAKTVMNRSWIEVVKMVMYWSWIEVVKTIMNWS
jgi:hypothetical protein